MNFSNDASSKLNLLIADIAKQMFKLGYQQGYHDCEEGESLDIDDLKINIQFKDIFGNKHHIKSGEEPIKFPSIDNDCNESHAFDIWHLLLAHSTFAQKGQNAYIIDPNGHKTAVIKLFEEK